MNCGTDIVRIMRSGQVSMVSDAMASMHQRQHGNGKKASPAADPDATGTSDGKDPGRHHWHLSDLLHPFQHHRK